MSPLEITMLLHYHCRADSYPWNGSSAEHEALRRFRDEGLVIDKGVLDVDNVNLTERGKAYIHFLTTLPLPVANWAIPGYQCGTLPKENDGTR